MIARIKVPKHKVFHANFMPLNEQSLLNLDFLHGKESIPTSDFWKNFASYKERQQQRQTQRKTRSCHMTLPGQIVQLVRLKDLRNVPCSCLLSCVKCIACCGMSHETKKYKVRWADPSDFAEIFVSPSMMIDHFPYNIDRALEVAAKSYGIALNQGSEILEEASLNCSQTHNFQGGTKKDT